MTTLTTTLTPTIAPRSRTARRASLPVLLALALVLPPAAVLAQDRPAAPPERNAPSEHRGASFDAERSVTHHTLPQPGGPLAYTAVAEFLPLRDGAGEEASARVFTVSYTLDGSPKRRRPVAFIFNGGPGAASAYLQMGAIGPKVVAFDADGALPTPPAGLIDNPDSWLAFCDLVFVDPVGTGFSRAEAPQGDKAKGGRDAGGQGGPGQGGGGRDGGGGDDKRYWNVEADTRSMAEIVRLWLTRNERWESPKLLVGESYGGFRVAKLASALIDGPGIAVNGVIMISPVVDFSTIRGGGLLASAFLLPSYAASAAADGRVSGTPEQAAKAAETFAMNGYLTGMAGLDYRGLDPARDFFAQVAHTIGLPPDMVTRNRGAVPAGVFARELLRDKGRVLSVYDGTFAIADPDPGAARLPFDPFLQATVPLYTTAFASYARQDLGVRADAPYHLLSDRVNRDWQWPRMRQPSAVDDLQAALALQPALRVLIVHGRTDLVTPYMASRWIAAHLELPPGEGDRVMVTVHEGGHMLYTRPSSRAALAADARALVAAVLPKDGKDPSATETGAPEGAPANRPAESR